MNQVLLPPSIETAQIDWQDGQPVCQRFNDVYFNRENGLEETRHVFIQNNYLPERFAGVGPGQHFVVAETGFGTGLNFLATWKLWHDMAPPEGSCLHFISVERYPLTRDDLSRALSLWPDLKELASELLLHYPANTRGSHRLVLEHGRVRLTLYFGDVLEAWKLLDFKADAWFMDGFAPACNPQMWHENIMAEVARHSRPGTTIATFTAAGFVRRQLSEAGFTVTKTSGFGRKRDMLSGHIRPTTKCETNKTERRQTVGIVGAGISGAILAANLAGRGFQVTLIDKATRTATGASGNSQGALYVKLGVDYNDQTELALTSLQFAQRFYREFSNRGWHPTGLIQLAYSDSEADRQKRFLAKNRYPESVVQPVTSRTASELAGQAVPYSGLWFPGSGWLQPTTICEQLTKNPRIAHHFGVEVREIRQRDHGWHLTTADGDGMIFDTIVLCAGSDTPELIPVKDHYRIKKIRGQVTELPDNLIDAPSLVLCGPGYVNPANQKRATVGATFDLHDQSESVSDASNRENIDMISRLLPKAVRASESAGGQSSVTGRVAFRCTTHDYQPIAGPLKTRNGELMNGAYLFTGLGSKGLTYATLLAEYLADIVSSQPLCLPANLVRRVETQRCYRQEVTHS